MKKKTPAKKPAPAKKKPSQGRSSAKAPAKKSTAAKRPARARKPRPKKLDPSAAAIRQVSDWILEGRSEPAIAESIKVIFRATNSGDFVSAAFVYLAELVEARPETRVAWHVAVRRELFRRTFEIHDFKTCRDILRDMAQLEGLYPSGKAAAPRKPAQVEDQELDGAGAEGIPTAAGFPLQ